jgi:hypothetical protein
MLELLYTDLLGDVYDVVYCLFLYLFLQLFSVKEVSV